MNRKTLLTNVFVLLTVFSSANANLDPRITNNIGFVNGVEGQQNCSTGDTLTGHVCYFLCGIFDYKTFKVSVQFGNESPGEVIVDVAPIEMIESCFEHTFVVPQNPNAAYQAYTDVSELGSGGYFSWDSGSVWFET
ncbi:MAG: hypothetical protein ABL921_00815 [Pirellula sp.]